MNTKTSWPHAPTHWLIERGTYIVTCGTYRKQHFLNVPEKLTLVRNLLLELAQRHNWKLQAWAVLSNHYHFVAASPDHPSTLTKMLSTLHTLSARDLNSMDDKPGRRIWYNYYDTRITYEKSWLARLKYVHHNPVHHGVVQNAELYEWCSAAWFARESPDAFVKTVNSFKIDQVKVYDDYESKASNEVAEACATYPVEKTPGVRQLDAALQRSAPQIPKRGRARALHIAPLLECGRLPFRFASLQPAAASLRVMPLLIPAHHNPKRTPTRLIRS
jgi:putative transposase